MTRRTGLWMGAVAALAAMAACNHESPPDCLHPPCPQPLAITLNVASAAGGPVPALTLTTSGATSGTGPCTQESASTTCHVPGTAGTYQLLLTAPGFVDKMLSVVVTGTTPACGCPTVEPQTLDVVLTPA